jgi:serine phosphatase RsbU (regulator of sigma subunit)
MLFGAIPIWSQTVDSLQWAERKLSQAYEVYGEQKYNTAEELGLKVFAFSDRHNEQLMLARSSALLSELNRSQGRYLDAIEYSIIGIENSKGVSSETYLANALSQVRCLDELEIWDRNVDLCDELKSHIKSSVSINEMAAVYYYLAKALIGLDRHDLANEEIKYVMLRGDFKNLESQRLKNDIFELEIDYLVHNNQLDLARKKALELIIKVEPHNNTDYLAHLYQKVASICSDLGLFQDALFYYNKASSHSTNDFFRKSLIFIGRAQVYIQANSLDLALIELEKAIEAAEALSNNFIKSIAYGLMARINGEKGFLSIALMDAQKGLSYAQSINDLPLQMEIHELMRDLHRAGQSMEEVKEQQKLCDELKSKILADLDNKRIQKAELLLRIRNKELTTLSKIQSQRNERILLNQQLLKAKEEQRYIELKLSKELALQNEVSAREKAISELRLLQSAHESDLQRLRIIELERIKVKEALRINELSNAQVEKEKNIEILRQSNDNLTKADQIKQLEIDKQETQKIYGIVFTISLLGIVVTLIYFLGSLRKKNKIIHSNSQDISRFNNELKEKNYEIISGIEYASKFQEIIFPKESVINERGLEGFVLHRALDLVSGDLPFAIKIDGYTYIAAVDCIGHGVSASMLSIMTYFNLSDIIKSGEFKNCADILQALHQRLLNRKDQDDFKSIIVSVDLALIRIPHFENKVQFAGANLPLIVKRTDDVEMIKGSPFSIGESHGRKLLQFENHDLILKSGDELYLFSDGFFHQFGGVDLRQKLSKKRTVDFVRSLEMKSFGNRKSEVAAFFDNWRSNAPQTDDMVFIGLKIANSGAPLLFQFSGEIDESANARMINELKQIIQKEIGDKKSSNLMLLASIELLDNALRYSDDSSVDIQVRDLGDKLRLEVSNLANAEDFKNLNHAILHYSQLTNPEMEDLYLAKLNHNSFNQRGGAGLGLLQLIRKGINFESITSEIQENNLIKFSVTVNFKK